MTGQHTIWKFPFAVMGSEVILSIPGFVRWVHVDTNPDSLRRLAVWALLDPKGEVAEHRLVVRGTGHQVGADETHLGTVRDGSLVWHIFEKEAA